MTSFVLFEKLCRCSDPRNLISAKFYPIKVVLSSLSKIQSLKMHTPIFLAILYEEHKSTYLCCSSIRKSLRVVFRSWFLSYRNILVSG